MKRFAAHVYLLAGLCIGACQSSEDEATGSIQVEKVSGFVQKGPFINGTSVMLSELRDDLSATGKNFNTLIGDNQGAFEVKNIILSSPFVEVKAHGFYFNEVTGQNSAAQLTLLALTDLTDKTTVNVNLLSHLEKSRVEYLLADGYSFGEAKEKAQQEILSIFEILKQDVRSAELLDISQNGEDNAILLAISVILQGQRSEAELTELLAGISADLREDGVLNNSSLGTLLINDAKIINLDMVRRNITERYAALGMDASVPDFEKYVQQFIENTSFEFNKTIDYPALGSYGPNLLSENTDIFPSWTGDNNTRCSFTAVLPKGTSVKVGFYPDLITPDPSTDTTTQSNVYADWSYNHAENPGWSFSDFNQDTWSREFYNIESGRKIELMFHLHNSGSARIEIYENGSQEATRVKYITW